jgi:hypothetical protein
MDGWMDGVDCREIDSKSADITQPNEQHKNVKQMVLKSVIKEIYFFYCHTKSQWMPSKIADQIDFFF